MTETTSLLSPLLTLFAAPSMAGIIASLLLRWFRSLIPYRRFMLGMHGFIIEVLYRRQYARVLVFVLSMAIGCVFAVLAAWMQGLDTLHAFDVALAGFVSIVASQIAHLPAMKDTPPL